MKIREIVDSKSRADWEYLIDQWIHNERNREMLKKHLLDGLSIKELADIYDLSWVQTQAVLSKAKEQLFKHA